jgi:hypothetical protein
MSWRSEVAETLRNNGNRDVSQGPSEIIGERTQALLLRRLLLGLSRLGECRRECVYDRSR